MMNMQGLMKQAQMMQKKMEEAQKKLAESEVTGSSGGGMVKAFNDAQGKVDAMMSDGMKDITGGLNLGGLKLPF